MRSVSEIYIRAGLVLFALNCLGENYAAASGELAWQSEIGIRFAKLAVPSKGKTGFRLISPGETGIVFTNHLHDATVAKNRLTEIGSGVALGDVDGDGWVDIFFCRMDGDNALYRNLGDWKFADVTQRSGIACPNQFSTGCVFADIDGDGDLDLLVNSLGGGTRAFLNDGLGSFLEMRDNRLLSLFGATSLALADVEGDGDLDLYATNYRTDTFHDSPPGLKITTRRRSDGAMTLEPANRFVPLQTQAGGLEILERGEVDVFYINVGGGRFSPIRWDIGVFLDENGQRSQAPPTDWGLSVIFRDLNGDSLPDLYVCNDFVYWPDSRRLIGLGASRFWTSIWMDGRICSLPPAATTMSRTWMRWEKSSAPAVGKRPRPALKTFPESRAVKLPAWRLGTGAILPLKTRAHSGASMRLGSRRAWRSQISITMAIWMWW